MRRLLSGFLLAVVMGGVGAFVLNCWLQPSLVLPLVLIASFCV